MISKRKKVILKSALSAFVVLLILAVFWQISRKNEAIPENKNLSVNQNLNIQPIEQKARLIDGLFVPQDYKEKVPVSVMIENSLDGWPIAGIDQANLVYETIAEATITRFLAFYSLDEIIEKIGPVRSARPYYVDWAREYDAIFAHVGGSPEALAQIGKNKINDLNQYYQSQYFWRNNTRPAPHNVYTSSALLKEARDNFNLAESVYPSWQYKEDEELSKRPDQQELEINFSIPIYKVNWHYDKEKNDYVRWQADKLYLTDNGSEVRAKNIIVQFTGIKIIDAIGRRNVVTSGSGKALLFFDGHAHEGSWQKIDQDQRTKFLDNLGSEIKLNRGTTWVEVVSPDTLIGY